MSIDSLDKCPYCDGDGGYEFVSVQRFSMHVGWDGVTDGEYTDTERETKPRCADCGKIIKDA